MATSQTELRDTPERLLQRLQFTVVRHLDGYLFGDYRGIFYGPSLDLAEVREYQPGDEVRRIDWNVTARMNRLFVRQYLEERELTAWLLVDLSPSMAFGTRTPCQWIVLATGSLFSKRTRTVWPSRTRRSGPGTWPL